MHWLWKQAVGNESSFSEDRVNLGSKNVGKASLKPVERFSPMGSKRLYVRSSRPAQSQTYGIPENRTTRHKTLSHSPSPSRTNLFWFWSKVVVRTLKKRYHETTTESSRESEMFSR